MCTADQFRKKGLFRGTHSDRFVVFGLMGCKTTPSGPSISNLLCYKAGAPSVKLILFLKEIKACVAIWAVDGRNWKTESFLKWKKGAFYVWTPPPYRGRCQQGCETGMGA